MARIISKAGTGAQTFAQKPASDTYISLRTIALTIKKRCKNDRIGLNGAASKNHWTVFDVEDGLVKLWNEQHPDLAVEEGDLIVACNGVQGSGEMVCEAMKNDMVLKITVAKYASAPSEKNAPSGERDDTSTTADDDVPSDDSFDAAWERQTTLDSAPTSTKQKFSASKYLPHCRAKIDDGPHLKDPCRAAKSATSSIKGMEEQAVPNSDIVEPIRKPFGWMCCSGATTYK